MREYMFDNSTSLTTFLLFLLVGSYFFLVLTKTNYDEIECKRYAKQRLIKSGSKVEGVLFVPDDPVKKVLLGLIYSERSYIKAAVYQLTDPDLLDALLEAHRRGVKVEIITDKSCLSSKYEKITELRNNGIAVYIYGEKQYSIMHNKFWVFGRNLCNKKILLSGSANATTYGTTRNEENVFVSDQANVVTQYDEKFDRLKKKITVMAKPKPKQVWYKNQYPFLRYLYNLRLIVRPEWIFK
jgi:phosphatidylserine/phosphatidylglycerophosphate/cardiolipin synthase-like enzyme